MACHRDLGIPDDMVYEMFETMLLARRIDERMWLLNRAGEIPFVISCQGHEAAQIGASFALDRTKDYILPYYRDLAVVLAFGMTAKQIMLSAFAKAQDPNSGGRQMPNHFSCREKRIVTGSSPVTTQVPHAAGFALAAKLEKKDFVTFATFGEGSSNQGDFHEGLNFAAVHKLPCIFMCENNRYAISVPVEKQLSCKSIADRAIGYGIYGVTVDGTDVFAVYEAVKKARERAANGEGPTLIEALTHRLTPHSSDDDDRTYRTQEEIEEIKKYDPLAKFKTYLYEHGLLTQEKENELEAKVKRIVDEATEYAQKALYAEPHEALRYVYEE